MTDSSGEAHDAGRTARDARRPERCGRARGLAALALAGLAATSSCTAGTSAVAPDSVPSAGSYPVATVPPVVRAVPAVSPGHYQVVAAGVPVRATLPGARVLVTALGPDVTAPAGPASPGARAAGLLTVRLTAEQGRLTMPAGGFLVLDEQRRPVRVQASASAVTATPGHPAVLALHAVFAGGHTTLTWQPLGKPLITWDFVIELD